MNNGFVTAPLGMEWSLRRALSPCDKLSTPESLRAPRFCPQWAVISKSFSVFLYPRAFPDALGSSFQRDFLNSATLWFSSWLGVFYCMKITTLAHPVFLWLRRKVFEVIPWMLLSSVGVLQLEHHILYKQPKRVSELFKERSTILECHWMSGELTRNSTFSF